MLRSQSDFSAFDKSQDNALGWKMLPFQGEPVRRLK